MNLRILLFGLLYFIAPNFVSGQVNGSTFSFTLDSASKTSAGVFKPDGTLVRTLWSIEPMSAGPHTFSWDGEDDNGNLVPGTYEIKVVSGNVKYTWERPVGNTSLNTSGSTVFHASQLITNMVPLASTGTMYAAVGYNEGGSVHFKFQIGTPRVSTMTMSGPSCTIRFLASDGKKVYFVGQYAEFMAGDLSTFVSAITPGGTGPDSIPIFASGTPRKTKNYTFSIADNVPSDNYLNPQHIDGLSVQTNGEYLFSSHGYENFIRILNKNTLAIVRTDVLIKPKATSIDPTNDNSIWIIHDSTLVSKYNINDDGTLSSPILTLPAFVNPLDVKVSPDGTKVGVIDRGNFHQVKFYNTNTGALINTLGRSSSYSNDPTVYDDKFYFSNTRIFTEDDWGQTHAFLSFEPNGSFWVGDYGNMRCQHFSSSNTYIDNIAFIGYSYSSKVDINNPSRVFSDYLEFDVDAANQKWILAKNWSWNNQNPNFYAPSRLQDVTTLSNGRTYALDKGATDIGFQVVELDPAVGMRFTGIYTGSMSYTGVTLEADGSLWQIGESLMGMPATWSKKALLGFDGSNNPIWNSSFVVQETGPIIKMDDPLSPGGYNSRSFKSSTGVYVAARRDGANGWHLGGIKDGEWKFKTALASGKNYAGPFPQTNYENGNYTNSGMTFAGVVERNIFFGQNGEFWKGTQTNWYKHYRDDGLQIGSFGTDGDIARRSGDIEAFPSMAGNANTGGYVKVGGDIYMYTCDEGWHSGVHQWKISNLSSIIDHPSIPVTVAVPSNGLRGYFYSSDDLNNCNTLSNSVQTIFASSPGLSVKWLGFVKPEYTENYTLYITTASGCRMWIGDSLIINAWENNSNTELTSATIPLDINTYHSLRIEAKGAITLTWSSASRSKQAIPSTSLFAAAEVSNTGYYDLQEGLKLDASLENGIYGYTRNPSTEILKSYDGIAGYWSVLTGTQSTNKKSPDVNIIWYPSSSYTFGTVSRDLGTNSLTNWKITGKLTFVSNAAFNSGSSDVNNFEIQDAAGKTIVLFERRADYGLYVNGQLLFRGNNDYFGRIMTEPQEIEITAAGSNLSFRYKDITLSKISPFDGTSTLLSPKTMRTYASSTTGHSQWINMASMRFYKDPATPVAVYRINAGGGQVTTSKGVFFADAYFTPAPGDTFSDTSSIAGTTDDALYQSERTGSAGTFSYAFPVINGQYKVVLHFAEIYYGRIGNRIFDVSAEGNKVLVDYDIFKKAGSLTAITESFEVNVTDGTLNIDFSSLASERGVNRPKVSAIEILSSSSNKAPVANGGDDITITLPANNSTLNGSATDSDGTISSYKWKQVSGPNTAIFSSDSVAAPTISGLIAGIYVFNLVVRDNLLSLSAPDELIVTVNPAPSTNTAIYRINAGGSQVTTSRGIFYADDFYWPTPGDSYSDDAKIGATTDEIIYQSERTGSSGKFGYAFPVSNGHYTVILHFAEIYYGRIGNRIFDVSAEGTKILDDYDIFKKAGGAHIATTESFGVDVTDGLLNIDFSSLASDGGLDRAKISAIEILSSSLGTAPIVSNEKSLKTSSLPKSVQQLAASEQSILMATVQPNPSANYFNFYIAGNKEPVDVRIYNTVGQLIESKANVIAGNTLRLGNNYRAGLYYAVVVQGAEKVVLKFIKRGE